MEDDQLCNVDPEDFEDLLLKVETSFGIRFIENELERISTFGELCDLIEHKVQVENSGDCTTQQAFYKLRYAFGSEGTIDICPSTLLEDLLPKRNRIARLKRIEKRLGFGLSILRPAPFITNMLAIILLAAILLLFFNWPAGLFGILFSIGGFAIARITGRELKLQTVGQVVEKMRTEHYVQSRCHPGTANKNEIEKVLIDLFSQELGLDNNKLNREAKLA